MDSTDKIKHRFLQIHGNDNVLVARQDLPKGTEVVFNNQLFWLATPVPSKHKFALLDLKPDDDIYMYGVLVGKAYFPSCRGKP